MVHWREELEEAQTLLARAQVQGGVQPMRAVESLLDAMECIRRVLDTLRLKNQ